MHINIPQLNPSVLGLDSFEGVVVLLLIGLCIWFLFRRTFRRIRIVLIILFAVEILYILGQSSFNNIVPLRNVFKYDIFSAIGQLFVGTKLGEWLTTFGTWFCNILLVPVNFLMNLATGH